MMNNVVSTVEPLFANIKKYGVEKVQLSNQSWFEIKDHKNDRFIYLQVKSNDMREDYNGIVFKLKFNHMAS